MNPNSDIVANRQIIRFVLPLALMSLLGACGARRNVPAEVPPDTLFTRALTALHNHKYTTAQEDFERFVLQYPSHPRLQEARLHLGDAYFGKKEYVTAADEYSRLANDYPAGPYADDARYKVCESYFKLSPKPQLDQQYTRAALDHCQSLIAYYSTSEFAPKAQALIGELRSKLAQKEYNTGEYYYKNRAFDSGVIYYQRAVDQYPDTPVAPRALMRLFETYTKINYKEEADAAKERLLKEYPNSPEAKQLQSPPTPTTP